MSPPLDKSLPHMNFFSKITTKKPSDDREEKIDELDEENHTDSLDDTNRQMLMPSDKFDSSLFKLRKLSSDSSVSCNES